MMCPVAPDFSHVLSECEEINSILYKPINSAQRIKYTCFNASLGYIILGSTSGSIYLFSREPCSFLQIIPLSQGVVSRVAISPDEKTVALATTRGTICLVSLKSTPQLMAVSMEHMCEQITCLCWNNNSTEIYVGDAAGRVSAIVLSIFTVNGIFQTPACMLMNLDSCIVQLNYLSPLLLVSTLTRCYVCDTIQEQYKQIGNKPRNGMFGACFYTHENISTNALRDERNINNARSAFNLISDNDSNNILCHGHSKIFCARPGSRLWEVSADGIVAKTHQFKNALAIPPAMIFRSSNNTESSQRKETVREWRPQSVNFSHLSIIARKYLFSYTTSGLYVIDPVNASVLLWNNEYTNIDMTAIVDNVIYLMTCDNEFQCLVLSSLDNLILQLYRRERYGECLNACFVYKSQLSRAIGVKKVVDLFEMEEPPREPQDEETLALLQPLITFLQIDGNSRPTKLDSGIVVVHSQNDGFADRKMHDCETTRSLASQSLEISSKDSSGMHVESERDRDENFTRSNALEMTTQDVLDALEETSGAKGGNARRMSDPQENVTHRVQSDLRPIYELVNDIRSDTSEGELEEIVVEMDRRMKIVNEAYRDSPGLQSFVYEVTRAAELHYYNTLLKNVSTQPPFRFIGNDYIVRQYARAFVEINAPAYARCNCGYPYPMDEAMAPKFPTIGEYLIGRYAHDLPIECSNICARVPYMWRAYLPLRIERRDTLDDLLRQCLQTRDNIVLSYLLPALNEQQWSCVGACLSEIEEGVCLFCAMPLARKSDRVVPIDWSGVAGEIMRREGPDEATAFLIKLESMIPGVNFDRSIFQSIVCTKMLHRHGLKKSIDFSKINQLSSEFGTICSSQVREELAKALEKDLKRPIDKNVFGTGAHHWGMRHQSKSLMCPCCTLSLQTPILLEDSGIAIFRCGHAYHVNCMIERRITRCNLH